MELKARVKIVMSQQLENIELAEIAGQTGTVESDLNDKQRFNKGYIIRLNENYMDEDEWFIPTESVVEIK